MANPVVARDHLGYHSLKDLAVLVVLKDRFTSISSGGDVVKRTGELDPQGSSHAQSLDRNWHNAIMPELTVCRNRLIN